MAKDKKEKKNKEKTKPRQMEFTHNVECDKCGYLGSGRGPSTVSYTTARFHEESHPDHRVTVKPGRLVEEN